MVKMMCFFLTAFTLVVSLSACTTKQIPIVFDSEGAVPGTRVAGKGVPLTLLGDGLEVGQSIADTLLVDAATMEEVSLKDFRGSILFLNIVPSLDTKVCETQTHYLGEQGDKLPQAVKRITISRDSPFAQTRFAGEAKLEEILYLSDYKEGAFGRAIGVLIDSSRLLARSVILVDRQGIVRYIQVVPEMTHLPDMERAFNEAIALANLP